jgi:hypothetical protein
MRTQLLFLLTMSAAFLLQVADALAGITSF